MDSSKNLMGFSLFCTAYGTQAGIMLSEGSFSLMNAVHTASHDIWLWCYI